MSNEVVVGGANGMVGSGDIEEAENMTDSEWRGGGGEWTEGERERGKEGRTEGEREGEEGCMEREGGGRTEGEREEGNEGGRRERRRRWEEGKREREGGES